MADAGAALHRRENAAGDEVNLLHPVTAKAWEKDDDLKSKAHKDRAAWVTTLILAFQSLGVVYGDIGTSPLYVYSTTFSSPPSEEDVIGVASLIFWTFTAVVITKYVLIVLRADDNGQGGTFALFSLLKRQAAEGELSSDRRLTQYRKGPAAFVRSSSRASPERATPLRPDWRQRFIQNKHTQGVVRVLVLFGVGAIMGDGVLTPAVSVVSACEGLQTAFSSVTRAQIDIIAIVILAVLFLVQRFGTGAIGFCFSPIICIWYAFNVGINIYNIIVYYPAIFKALSPHYWFAFFLRGGTVSWTMLGGVVLCITGVEALFADMGHFSRPAIQLSCLCIVYPSLMITYFGQGAWLIKNPDQFASVFFGSLPNGTFWPMFVVATLAAIIASQALISAVFQIVKQAIAQGFFPRFKVYHTSKKHWGQIYIPVMNYMLMILCLAAVGGFKTSAAIGNAYGLAVLCDMLLTTHFLTLVMLTVWKLALPLPFLFYILVVPIEATYLSASLNKVPVGGWFTIMMSVIYGCIMLLWSWGKGRKDAYFRGCRLRLDAMMALEGTRDEQLSFTIAQQKLALAGRGLRLKRVRGIGVWYSDDIHGVPPVLVQAVSRLPVVYEVNIFLTNRFVPLPTVADHERLLVEQLGMTGFYHIIARYGYAERVVQDEAFMKLLLGRVSASLLGCLQDELAAQPEARAALGLPDIFVAAPDPSEIANPKTGELVIQIPDVTGPERPRGRARLENAFNIEEPSDVSNVGTRVPATGPHRRASTVRVDEHGVTRYGADAADLDATFGPGVAAALQEAVVKLGALGDAPHANGTALTRARLLTDELAVVRHALRQSAVVYVLGHSHVRLAPLPGGWRGAVRLPGRYLLEVPYKIMVDVFQEAADVAFNVPSALLLEIGLPYDL